MTRSTFAPALASLFLLVACSSSSSSPAPSAPQGGDDDGAIGQGAAALEFRGDCSPSSCPGLAPEEGGRYVCSTPPGAAGGGAGSTPPGAAGGGQSSPPGGGCGWSEPDPNATVSFRQCKETECATKPTIACPDGYVLAEGVCGSENDAPCAWTTSCVEKPSTEPCDESKCPQAIPAMAMLCGDGPDAPVADMKCMKMRSGCQWQPVCPK